MTSPRVDTLVTFYIKFLIRVPRAHLHVLTRCLRHKIRHPSIIENSNECNTNLGATFRASEMRYKSRCDKVIVFY